MKEFINKLIGRLEARKKIILSHKIIDAEDESMIFTYNETINIVNELAEEYTNTSTDTSSGWVACSERLPKANQKVLTCDKDGWISVNVNMPYIGVRNDFECGYYVAWMPLPAPYKEGATENE